MFLNSKIPEWLLGIAVSFVAVAFIAGFFFDIEPWSRKSTALVALMVLCYATFKVRRLQREVNSLKDENQKLKVTSK